MQKDNSPLQKFAMFAISKEEQKLVTGKGIYCSFGGAQYECQGGTLQQCAEACNTISNCGGCCEFQSV